MNSILARKLLAISPEKVTSNSVFRLHNSYQETMKRVRSYILENVVKNYHIVLPQKSMLKFVKALLERAFKESSDYEISGAVPWQKQCTIVVKKYFRRSKVEEVDVIFCLKFLLICLSRTPVLKVRINDRLDNYSNLFWSCYE